jgi:hypothetical protein
MFLLQNLLQNENKNKNETKPIISPQNKIGNSDSTNSEEKKDLVPKFKLNLPNFSKK